MEKQLLELQVSKRLILDVHFLHNAKSTICPPVIYENGMPPTALTSKTFTKFGDIKTVAGWRHCHGFLNVKVYCKCKNFQIKKAITR